MNVRIDKTLYGKTVAIAVSGGADSMALLHYAVNRCDFARFKIIALNVEHGIRGESSLRDTAFVKDYCANNNIPLLTYQVDAPKKAHDEKISLEQAARALRYECFYDAVNAGKCDAVFTAHHSADNLESVLFNLFRGTSVKGLTGIKDYGEKIYRPFIGVTKAEISEYVKTNGVPFVNDETNCCIEYTRNYLRLNVIPKIKEIFPEAEKSVLRLSETLKTEDAFLDAEAEKALEQKDGNYSFPVTLPRAVMARAIVLALKKSGVTHDYEKVHIDDVCALTDKENGKTINLPRGVVATREYDKIAIYRPETHSESDETPFSVGAHTVNGQAINAVALKGLSGEDLKKGFYADLDKIPKTAVLRFRKKGDRFTKFGGGTKSLSDYLTDRKIPKKDRDSLILLANGKEVLFIFKIAISDGIKVDNRTKNIVKFI